MSNWGREVIQIVDVDQPLCSRTFGTSPCMAIVGLSGDRKCFNTRSTCHDLPNYDPQPLTLRFMKPQGGLMQYEHALPLLNSADTTPGAINLGGMNRSMSALGQRERVSVSMADDGAFSDLRVDKYRAEREDGRASGKYIDMPGTVPGTGNNLLETSDAAANRFTSDVDFKIYVEPDDWTPSALQALIAKWDIGGGSFKKAFRWSLLTTGALEWRWSADGSAELAATGSTPLGYTSGAHWIRVTFDANDGVSPTSRVTKFWKSDDYDPVDESGTWTLVETITQAGNTSIFQGAGVPRMTIGSTKNGTTSQQVDLFAGHVYYASVTGTIDGAPAQTMNLNACKTVGTGAGFSSSEADATLWSFATPSVGDVMRAVAIVPEYVPEESGSFWGKFIARNPFHSGYALRVREGYVGDDLDDMRVRHYVIDKIDGPTNGQVSITAKDRFSVIEAKKAVAPTASRGELAADISAVATSATLSPTGIGNTDYPVVGSPGDFYVAIGKEIIRTQRSGDTLNFIARAQFGTTAEEHDQEDAVQLVLVYTAQRPHNIAYDLLVNYTAVGSDGSPSTDYIDKADWDSRASSITELYTGVIAEPTPVAELLAELEEQAGFTLWPDVTTGLIEFTALRAGAVDPTVDDDAWILADTLSIKRQIDKRVSQVWVYYGQINPLEALDEPKNYRSRLVTIDADAEASTQYGVPAVREIFSRWIPQFGRSSAETTAERILTMFRDPPIEASFEIDIERNGELGLARYFFLETFDIQDAIGDADPTAMATIELERNENTITVKAQQVAFSADSDTGNFDIPIENDAYNLNLRSIFDAQYEMPEAGSPSPVVTFTVENGVTVGSTSTDTAAIRTGEWPAWITLVLKIRGRVEGKGGIGGTEGSNGGVGGDALLVEHPLHLDNDDGEIWGGGGGGGSGEVATDIDLTVFPPITVRAGPGGGGAGAGTDPGTGGVGGTSTESSGSGSTVNGGAGGAATATAGGTGGTAGTASGGLASAAAGAGGAGGGPGLAGSAGSAATDGTGGDGPGSGGAAGKYINGIALVTQGSPSGDLRGNVA